MICAGEASIISTVRAEEQAKEREQKIKTFQQRSINFCEKVIGEKIAEACVAGKKYVRIFFGAKECGEELYIKGHRMGIVTEKTTYANGKPSRTSDRRNPVIDLDIICQYLEQHCYKTSRIPEWYKEWGLGDRKGIELWIEW